MSHAQHTSYLWGLSNPIVAQKFVNKIVKEIKKSKLDFDTILYTGISGGLFATAVGIKLKKHICAVRKEKSHSDIKLEGYLGKKSLFLDDFFSEGNTFINIYKAVKSKTKIVGVFTYMAPPTNSWREFIKKEADCDVMLGIPYDDISRMRKVTEKPLPVAPDNLNKIGQTPLQIAVTA